jgi:hypothetical protein
MPECVFDFPRSKDVLKPQPPMKKEIYSPTQKQCCKYLHMYNYGEIYTV